LVEANVFVEPGSPRLRVRVYKKEKQKEQRKQENPGQLHATRIT
jgi:hypothetical protein